ncbi:hypothetical protein DICVIV_09852 [Dictyocaulus viviparus]|uniref:Uncharacterized protein n=1 Tax=Dictyocaulus viviparus TaxID=29172 RepID=A0A0D8XJW1_DICVI|nr:hypothetical protein DICVIV_09852 [Dictyocaulus viviparus]
MKMLRKKQFETDHPRNEGILKSSNCGESHYAFHETNCVDYAFHETNCVGVDQHNHRHKLIVTM